MSAREDEAGVAVRVVHSAGDREAAYAVRRRVFQEEQGVPPELEFDDEDDTAVHVLAQVESVVAGTGRLVLHGAEAKVGRMAVLREHRGRGIGRALLDRLIEEARHRGVRRFVLHAQVHAIPFYEGAGFAADGEEFEEAGIPHRRMEKVLSVEF